MTCLPLHERPATATHSQPTESPEDMPFKTALLYSAVALSALPQLAQAATVLRLRCEGSNMGAQVFVNDQPKGECHSDEQLNLLLEPGTFNIRAVKPAGVDQERVWERRVAVADGVVSRMDIELSAPRLTKEAVRARAVRAAQASLAAAERGDIAAMDDVANRLQTGEGLTVNAADAERWRNRAEAARGQAALKAAEGGDVVAMRELVSRYTNGNGLAKNPGQAAAWQARIPEAENKERLRLAELERQRQAKAAAEERQRQAAIRAAETSAKRAALQARKDEVKYFPTTMKEMESHNRQMQKDFLFGFASSLTASPSIVASFLFEAATVAPSATMEIKRIDKELDALPTAWAKPDTLVARALAQRTAAN